MIMRARIDSRAGEASNQVEDSKEVAVIEAASAEGSVEALTAAALEVVVADSAVETIDSIHMTKMSLISPTSMLKKSSKLLCLQLVIITKNTNNTVGAKVTNLLNITVEEDIIMEVANSKIINQLLSIRTSNE